MELELPFISKNTVIVGPNGVGKTNIVESLILLSNLQSHRVADHGALIRFGQEKSQVEAEVTIKDRKFKIQLELADSQPLIARIDGAAVKPLKKIRPFLPTVIFSPEDLKLIKDLPQYRRKYIDNLIDSPLGLAAETDFNKVLKHKNALLKSLPDKPGADQREQLNVWEEKFIELAAEIIYNRLQVINELTPIINHYYATIAPHSPQVTLKYHTYNTSDSVAEIKAALKTQAQDNYEQEIIRKQSLYGPHREDIAINIGVIPSRVGSSHGESWSLALALRMAEFDFHMNNHRIPLVILDDVFAELDTNRRALLGKVIEKYPQVIITAAILADVPQEAHDTIYTVSAEFTVDPIRSYLS